MTSKHRAYLRGQANNLSATITIGKAGVSPELVKMVDEALAANALVKVSVLCNTDIPIADAARMVSERTRSEIVQVIGRKIVLFKPQKHTKTHKKGT